MNISILFNWPISTNSARISFGGFNVEDPNYLLKVGVITRADSEHVRWLKAEFLDNSMLGKLEFDVERGDKVVVQKFTKNDTATAIGSYTWDINEKWPPGATGGTSVDIPWTF